MLSLYLFAICKHEFKVSKGTLYMLKIKQCLVTKQYKAVRKEQMSLGRDTE